MMSTRLFGKTCFVTGGAQGIGRAIAERLATGGAKVITADLTFGPDAPGGENIALLQLDVTDEIAVASAGKAHENVSVLINCVGFVVIGNLLSCTMADIDKRLNINVRSMALMIRAFLPAMLQRGDGTIINIASVVSTVMAAPDRFAYATSKAAVLALSTSVARDFISSGIRCNAISPGTVESPSLLQRFEATGDANAARCAFIARQPIATSSSMGA